MTVTPDLSLVLVTYHSSAELPACIGSFRRQAEQLGQRLEVIVVDHSEDRQEQARLAALPIDRCLVRDNRGYAAGLNTGAAAATGRVLLLANPDIELLPGGLGALLKAATEGLTVAGPTLVWDAAGQLLLPVPENPAPTAEMWRAISTAWQACWRLGLAAHLDRCWRLWAGAAAQPVSSLRGPLLVLSRESWQQLGPLDEGYFLYYEETEWLWRARHRGARLLLVGAARAVHRWGHATRRHPDREALEAQSRIRFQRRCYPPAARWLVTRLEGRSSAQARGRRVGLAAAAAPIANAEMLPRLDADLWLVSPFSHLKPTAGWLGGGAPPAELLRLTNEGTWFAAAARRSNGRWTLAGSWCWRQA